MAANAKGGPRVRPGRPLGSVAAKHQITAAQIGTDDYLPVAYMLALMRDESAEPQRRDAMAIQAAPYCHPRLAAVATTNTNATRIAGDVNLVQIFAVPRGAALDMKSGTVMIEGNATELSTVQPYAGTAPLQSADADCSLQNGAPATGAPRSEPLPVFDMDVRNVTRLDQYRDKDSD